MSKFISRALDRCNTNAKKQTKEQSSNPPPPYSYICTGGSTTATPTNITEGYVCPAGFYCTAGPWWRRAVPLAPTRSGSGYDKLCVFIKLEHLHFPPVLTKQVLKL